MFGKMPIAHDGSPGCSRALASGPELATRLEVGLAMIFVERLPRFPTGIGGTAEAKIDVASAFEKVVASAAKFALAQVVAFESHISLGIGCRVSSNSCGAADMLS
jgi:hypothetical protein